MIPRATTGREGHAACVFWPLPILLHLATSSGHLTDVAPVMSKLGGPSRIEASEPVSLSQPSVKRILQQPQLENQYHPRDSWRLPLRASYLSGVPAHTVCNFPYWLQIPLSDLLAKDLRSGGAQVLRPHLRPSNQKRDTPLRSPFLVQREGKII